MTGRVTRRVHETRDQTRDKTRDLTRDGSDRVREETNYGLEKNKKREQHHARTSRPTSPRFDESPAARAPARVTRSASARSATAAPEADAIGDPVVSPWLPGPAPAEALLPSGAAAVDAQPPRLAATAPSCRGSPRRPSTSRKGPATARGPRQEHEEHEVEGRRVSGSAIGGSNTERPTRAPSCRVRSTRRAAPPFVPCGWFVVSAAHRRSAQRMARPRYSATALLPSLLDRNRTTRRDRPWALHLRRAAAVTVQPQDGFAHNATTTARPRPATTGHTEDHRTRRPVSRAARLARQGRAEVRLPSRPVRAAGWPRRPYGPRGSGRPYGQGPTDDPPPDDHTRPLEGGGIQMIHWKPGCSLSGPASRGCRPPNVARTSSSRRRLSPSVQLLRAGTHRRGPRASTALDARTRRSGYLGRALDGDDRLDLGLHSRAPHNLRNRRSMRSVRRSSPSSSDSAIVVSAFLVPS